ncbi:potassium channel family protein [Bacillus testis]|uniref:potassium channel family protein n=1 Tax=Bacillus testis TaxID=1622072 RepID=UPI00067F378E|nr:TrkA family potassium uptake protein [Bacillus testis]
MRQYLVIGAGRFGRGVVKELYDQRAKVVVCDTNEQKLDEIDQYATHAIIGDFRDNDVLDELNIEEFDTVFIAIGTDAFSAILITKKIKERNAKRIVAKSISREVGEILLSIGADRVIYPEEEAGKKAARQELMSGIIEYYEITNDVSIVEMDVPRSLYGKSLCELDFSKKYDLVVSLIIRDDKPLLSHFADVAFKPGDRFLVIGQNKKIEKFKKKYN